MLRFTLVILLIALCAATWFAILRFRQLHSSFRGDKFATAVRDDYAWMHGRIWCRHAISRHAPGATYPSGESANEAL